jgi:pyruvate/2-oxoglutarate dehydrogenase complex dihydrolipoamide dehydrogenase (E3) component
MTNAATPVEKFDALVLGSGEAGKYLSWSLGAEGKRVALVERRYVGGSCPNIACLPSKNVVHSAKVAWYARRLKEFGLNTPAPGIDMTVVRDRKRAMVNGSIEFHNQRFAAAHVEFIRGRGVFTGPRTLSVELEQGGVRSLAADTVIVSTGSRAIIPDIAGLHEAQPMTHVEELELDTLPGHLIILGGGYVGLEFAQAMVRFGSSVTVIDRGERLLPREDEDVAAELRNLLEAEGVRFVLRATVETVAGRSGDSVVVHINAATGKETIKATHILAAAGRAPNTDGIGLQTAGIELTASGHIKVNEVLKTTADNVYAVGDCAGSPHFTHVAFDDYRIVQRTLRGEARTTLDARCPMRCSPIPSLRTRPARDRRQTAGHSLSAGKTSDGGRAQDADAR